MATAEQWEERHGQPGFWAGTQPAPFLTESLPFLPRGRALDLAMGEGRNAVWLASKGWQVVGIDRSAAALTKAESFAREHGVSAQRGSLEGVPGQAALVLVETDLERASLPPEAFDVVLCFNYLQRSLFVAMERSLRSGGVLVYQTYTIAQLDYPEGPRKREYLLELNELLTAFPGLETLYYSESNSGKGIAQLLARRPAS